MIAMSHPLDEIRLDKTAFAVETLGQEPDDLAYWLSRPVEERWAALELLRMVNYGYDPAHEGFQRVLEIIDIGER
jgi:hypothetical protein